MTVTVNDGVKQVTAVGGETSVTYDFRILDEDDLVVTRKPSAGSLSTLVLGTDYTVDGVGNALGGNVTFDTGVFPSGLTADDVVTMFRDTAIERSSDFQTEGDFRATVVNEQFDDILFMIQELATRQGRSVERPRTSQETYDLAWPDGATASNQVPVVTTSGITLAALTDLGDSSTLVSAFMDTVLVAASAAAAQILLGLEPGVDVQAYNADTLFADESDNLTVGYTCDVFDYGNTGTDEQVVSLTDEPLQTMGITGSFTLSPPASGNGVAVILATTDATGGYSITTSGFTKVNGAYTSTANLVHRFTVTKNGSTSILDIDQVA